MTNTQTLTERDLFRSFWDDGLLDLLCGAALLLSGLGWQSEIGALAVVQAPLWIVLWGPLRHRLVEPRAGYVRFTQARQQRTALGLRWALTLGLGLFALVAVAALVVHQRSALPSLHQWVDALPAVLVAGAAALAALLTGAARFYAYGLGLLAAGVVTVLFALGPAFPLVVVALAVLAAGAALLGRFLRASRNHEEAA